MNKLTRNSLFLLLVFALLPAVETVAQDWKDILKGVASEVGKKAGEKISEKMDTLVVTGSWQYVRPDVKLESDDLLSKAGSELASKKAEEHLVSVLTKIGINENTVFTFNADSTYTMRTDKRTLHGTYSINKATREIYMTSRLNTHFTAKVDKNILKPNVMSIRFKAEKLMGLVKYVSGTLAQKSDNKSIALINKALGKYNGLQLGFELQKTSQPEQAK